MLKAGFLSEDIVVFVRSPNHFAKSLSTNNINLSKMVTESDLAEYFEDLTKTTIGFDKK